MPLLFSGCTIPNNVLASGGIKPLILQRNALNQITFLYPNHNNGMITIPSGNTIYLVCPGRTNSFTHSKKNELMAICEYNTIFSVDGKLMDIKFLTCKHHSDLVGSYTNRLPCPTKREVYRSLKTDIKPAEIGFQTNLGFIRTIDLCFDTRYRQTLATYFKMSKMIGTVQNTDVR